MQNFCKKNEQTRGEKQSKKTGERKRNFLNLVSTYFVGSFYTYNYFPAPSTYKMKRSLFTNKFLEYYVGPQQTHIFTYHKPRLAKHNQSKR
jgi:hypothetical protein